MVLLRRQRGQCVDNGLDVIDIANQLLDVHRLFLAGHAAFDPNPAALSFDSNAGVGKSTICQDCFLDARDDLLVIQVGVWQSTAT